MTEDEMSRQFWRWPQCEKHCALPLSHLLCLGALCLGTGVQNCLWWPLQRVGGPSAPPSPGPIRIVPSALSPLDQQTPHSGPLQAKSNSSRLLVQFTGTETAQNGSRS